MIKQSPFLNVYMMISVASYMFTLSVYTLLWYNFSIEDLVQISSEIVQLGNLLSDHISPSFSYFHTVLGCFSNYEVSVLRTEQLCSGLKCWGRNSRSVAQVGLSRNESRIMQISEQVQLRLECVFPGAT